MDPLTGTVVFFDIGGTLASVYISAGGDRIERLAVYPDVLGILRGLRQRKVRLGVVSDPGPLPAEEVDRALAEVGLLEFFEPDLVVYGRKDSPRVFEHAAERAGAADRLLFVGEDANERAQALRAGMLVAPHPRLAEAVLNGQAHLRYLRITVPAWHATEEWRAALRDLPLLAVHTTGPAGTTVYAVATTSAAAQLDDLGFRVDRLGVEDEPLTTDLYVLRDDRQTESGFLAPDGNSQALLGTGTAAGTVLASTDDGLVVAVPAGVSVETYHFDRTRHGHNLRLVPTVQALARVDEAPPTPAPEAVPVTITPEERQVIEARTRPQDVSDHLARYTGAAPAGEGAELITSRHIQHPDNAAAVDALVADLDRIGAGRFVVRRHSFPHEGQQLQNVEAELPGTGLDGVVLVTAHMDSTGALHPGYKPSLDPAPGADDDGSGVAGVLAAADAVQALDAALGIPRRAVRFVLFNAEEHGLVGSLAYAGDQASLGDPVVGVFQMDMIGWDVLPGRTFELHAGITGRPVVEERSLALARRIADLVPQISPGLPAPQVYPHDGEPDPAEARSDHFSFQLYGHPACLASEDLFAGPGSDAPPAEMNPHYHTPADASINADYASDIVRAVTAAAWFTATR
ncbi:M28 family peptidase [Geodermatophilus obscurus]|uniref:Peptidase M28 n=1 Tax=Geodermatophilus obscurus (strain ATCC 25078 / DSM 43160 / JCM 3152 / CCUG 61914 / KCC A-0152 / KCTC 9177 / NBRC 13315 / NRRL B-3577 / G-20) TaxID=526225 RepID=D2SAL1_GEOOG|nr:M28 family peptidase [Geodermatophilus obscurus]ADB73940.1 peptidase M28 [Geodermatophilus obscurus DSM 43160]